MATAWTPEMIREAVGPLIASDTIDTVTLDGTTVRFCQHFAVEDMQEVHDIATQMLFFLQDELAPLGLVCAEVESDNESLWGVIVPRSEAP